MPTLRELATTFERLNRELSEGNVGEDDASHLRSSLHRLASQMAALVLAEPLPVRELRGQGGNLIQTSEGHFVFNPDGVRLDGNPQVFFSWSDVGSVVVDGEHFVSSFIGHMEGEIRPSGGRTYVLCPEGVRGSGGGRSDELFRWNTIELIRLR